MAIGKSQSTFRFTDFSRAARGGNRQGDGEPSRRVLFFLSFFEREAEKGRKRDGARVEMQVCG